jgi:hypothetical protein
MTRMTVPYLAASLRRNPVLLASVLSWVRWVRHAQVGTQHIDTSLPVLLPVIGQPSHRVNGSQTHRSGHVRSQPIGCSCEPLVKGSQPFFSECPVELLPLNVELILDDSPGVLADTTDAERLHAQAPYQGQEADARSDPGRSYLRVA